MPLYPYHWLPPFSVYGSRPSLFPTAWPSVNWELPLLEVTPYNQSWVLFHQELFSVNWSRNLCAIQIRDPFTYFCFMAFQAWGALDRCGFHLPLCGFDIFGWNIPYPWALEICSFQARFGFLRWGSHSDWPEVHWVAPVVLNSKQYWTRVNLLSTGIIGVSLHAHLCHGFYTLECYYIILVSWETPSSSHRVTQTDRLPGLPTSHSSVLYDFSIHLNTS